MSQDLIQWLHQQAPARRIYQSIPLKLVLCQVRFPVRFGLDDRDVQPFQAAIEDDYPLPRKQEPVASFQLGDASGQVEFQQALKPGPQWQFLDSTESWTVTLTHDSLSLETRSYEHFDDFLSRLRAVVDALVDTFRLKTTSRIGLRYINEILSTDTPIETAIRSELLGPLTVGAIRSNAEQAVQILSLVAGESRITVHHGLLPSGSTVIPKRDGSPNTAPFYLLDTDMFEEFSSINPLPMQTDSVCNKVKAYHETVTEFFRWATTDQYRSGLGEIENGS